MSFFKITLDNKIKQNYNNSIKRYWEEYRMKISQLKEQLKRMKVNDIGTVKIITFKANKSDYAIVYKEDKYYIANRINDSYNLFTVGYDYEDFIKYLKESISFHEVEVGREELMITEWSMSDAMHSFNMLYVNCKLGNQ